MLTLICHNMEIKATIGNTGFLMYKKHRCSYKHISNYIRNIFKKFAAFKREVSFTAQNRPLFERQDRCSLFSVLCYFRYFVRE